MDPSKINKVGTYRYSSTYFLVYLDAVLLWIQICCQKTVCSLLNPAPTFIEVVSDPLGDHEYDHDGEAVGHIPRRLDQDDGQRDGHPHHASCQAKNQIKTLPTPN